MMAQILYAFLGAVVLGVVLVVVGLRGKRLNNHPVCRWCGFDLEGVYPAGVTCPECGAGLKRAKAVRIGARRKRWIVAGLGALLVLLPVVTFLLVGGAMLSGADLNKHKPFGLLMLEARYAGATLAHGAAKEFLERLRDDKLSEGQAEKLVAQALEFQTDLARPWCSEWGDFIEEAHLSGKASKDDLDTYMNQSAVLECKTRPTTGSGDDIPLVVKLKEARAGSKSQYAANITLVEARVGGKSARVATTQQMWFQGSGGGTPIGTLMIGQSNMMFGPGYDGWAGAMLTPLETIEPGTAAVEVTVRCLVYEMNAGMTWSSEDMAKGIERSFTINTRIVEDADAVVSFLPESDGTRSHLQAMLNPSQIMQMSHRTGLFSKRDRSVQMQFTIGGARTPFAFDIFLRYEGKDVRIGSIASGETVQEANDWAWMPGATNAAHRVIFSRISEALPTTVDLVFKPSKDVAKRTLDLDEIYGGEIVVEKVSVQNMGE